MRANVSHGFRALHTSSLVYNELGVDDYPPVVSPFSPGEEDHDEQGDNGDNATRRSPYPRILDCFCEGIEPCESRLGGHVSMIRELEELKRRHFASLAQG